MHRGATESGASSNLPLLRGTPTGPHGSSAVSQPTVEDNRAPIGAQKSTDAVEAGCLAGAVGAPLRVFAFLFGLTAVLVLVGSALQLVVVVLIAVYQMAKIVVQPPKE